MKNKEHIERLRRFRRTLETLVESIDAAIRTIEVQDTIEVAQFTRSEEPNNDSWKPDSLLTVMSEIAREFKAEGVQYDPAAVVRSLDEED